MCESSREGEHGFSLLETIIALVILSLALATLFDAYGDGLRAITASNRHGEARLLAQSLLAEVTEPARPGTRSGRTNSLAWRLDVVEATGDLAATGKNTTIPLYDVKATVGWNPGRTIILRTLRLGDQPKSAQQTEPQTAPQTESVPQ